MKRKYFAIALTLILFGSSIIGCTPVQAAPSVNVITDDAPNDAPVAEPNAAPAVPDAPAEEVTLTIAGSWPDCRALDVVASAFTAKYPNCTIEYEYLQDYYPSLEKRLTGAQPVDLFFTTNIQADSALLPYALDLNSCEGLDLSNTFDGLIQNFIFREDDPAGNKLYAIPLGAELRGMYVNVTLLSSLGLEVPTDQASLLAACQVLKDNGYIPFHDNPGNFSQLLIYPWICNLIANSDDPKATYDTVNAHGEGLSEMFREPCQFLYTLVENNYYDYKRAQTELELFTETTDLDAARYFLNIKANGDSWEKVDDVGQIAFMPFTMSKQDIIDKTRDDYHSEIEYQFILSPIGKDGGYAYMSPAHGIAACKSSENVEWSIKFLNFLFQPENNAAFAEAFNAIPNTKEAFSYISSLYDVPNDHISHLGQVTFNYGFYEAITPVMTDISKANNPKYMQEDGTLYPFEHYMQELEESFKAQ